MRMRRQITPLTYTSSRETLYGGLSSGGRFGLRFTKTHGEAYSVTDMVIRSIISCLSWRMRPRAHHTVCFSMFWLTRVGSGLLFLAPFRPRFWSCNGESIEKQEKPSA